VCRRRDIARLPRSATVLLALLSRSFTREMRILALDSFNNIEAVNRIATSVNAEWRLFSRISGMI
jgi:hypothetical protein